MSNRINRPAVLLQGVEAIEDIDRSIELVNEDIKALKDKVKVFKADRKGTMGELKADGFDPPAVEQMIRERKMDENARRLFHAKLQTYRAMLGMLDGTPLGESARQAFEEEAQQHKRRDEPPPDEDVSQSPAQTAPTAITPEDLERAKSEGAEAAKDGNSVTDNPYPGNQAELRAAWDVGWCSELGSDGMEIPAAFRRPEKTDQPDKSDEEGGEGQGEP